MNEKQNHRALNAEEKSAVLVVDENGGETPTESLR
jgi:hypothetical protein